MRLLAAQFLSLVKKVVAAGEGSFSVASPALAARTLGGSLLAPSLLGPAVGRAVCLSYRPVTHSKSSQFLPLSKLDDMTQLYSN